VLSTFSAAGIGRNPRPEKKNHNCHDFRKTGKTVSSATSISATSSLRLFQISSKERSLKKIPANEFAFKKNPIDGKGDLMKILYYNHSFRFFKKIFLKKSGGGYMR